MKKAIRMVLLSAATVLATTTMNAGLVYRNMFPVEEIAIDMTEQLDYRLRLNTRQFDQIFYYYCDWIDDALDRMEYNGLFPISDRQFDIMLDRGFSYFYDDDYVFVARSRFFRSVLSSSQYRLWRNIELGRRTDVNVYVNIYPFGFPRLSRPYHNFVFHPIPSAPYHRHDNYRPAPRPNMGHNMAQGSNKPRPEGNMPGGNHNNDRNDRGNGTVSGNHGNAVSGGEANRGGNGSSVRPSSGSSASSTETRREERNGATSSTGRPAVSGSSARPSTGSSTSSTETRRDNNSMSNSNRPSATRIDYSGNSTSSSSRGTSTRTESRRTSTTSASSSNRSSSASQSSSSSNRSGSSASRSSSSSSNKSSSSSKSSSSNSSNSSSSSSSRTRR